MERERGGARTDAETEEEEERYGVGGEAPAEVAGVGFACGLGHCGWSLIECF